MSASRDKKADALEAKDRGNKCLADGNFDGAIDHYTTAMKLDDTNAVFYSNRSAAYLSKGFNDSALKDAEVAIKLRPNWNKGYARKGAALHGSKKYGESAQAYEEGLKICPGDAMLENGLKQVEEDKATSASNSAGGMGGMPGDLGGMFAGLFGPDMFSKLESNPTTAEYLKDPSFTQILTLVQSNPSMLNAYLKDPRMMQVITTLLTGGGGGGFPNASEPNMPPASSTPPPKTEQKSEPSPPVVEETAEEAQKRSIHESAMEHKKRGNDLYKEKKFDEALQAYEKAIEIESDEPTYYSNIAAVYLEQNRFDECIAQSKKACDIAKSTLDHTKVAVFLGKAWTRIGNAYMKQEKFEDALDAYDTSLMENPSKDTERRKKKLKKAMADKKEKDYLSPEEGLLAKQRGNEFFKEGNWPKAVAEYSDAIKRDPSNPVYYCNRAAAYSKLMEFGHGMKDCEKALTLDPEYVKAWGRKGDIEFFLKKYHRAMESYQAGLAIDAANVNCLEGQSRTVNQINMCMTSGKHDPERAKRAMEDPEIQALLKDPEVSTVLQEMQNNPQEAQKAMGVPRIAAKISTLIAAGVLSMGGP